MRLLPPTALLAILLPLGAAQPDELRFRQERLQLREQRMELRAQAAADRARRAAHAEEVILGLIDDARANRVPGQDAQFATMVRALRRLDPAVAERVAAAAAALPGEPASAERRAAQAWERAHGQAMRKILERTGRLLNRAVDMRLNDLAYEFLREILTFDPDRAPLRRQLGQTLVDGEWLGPFAAGMAEQGLRWDHELGWMAPALRERYDRGEYFDLQENRWTTLAEAEAAHARMDDPWVIRTAHLELRSTLPLADVVAIADKLEEFYAQVFASLAGFFTKGKADYELILGIAEHEPLVVHVYRDQAQYRQARPDSPAWSAGQFDSGDRASFFYGRIDSVMYHEFTHQILHIFSGTNRAPAWLVEGIAVYAEAPVFEDGDMRLGDLAANRNVRSHLRAARRGEQLPLDRLLELETGDRWRAAVEPGPQYDAAGALAWFGMEAGERRYRADFVDFLRDSYLGLARYPLWSYLGMDRQAFVEAYGAWEAEAAGP